MSDDLKYGPTRVHSRIEIIDYLKSSLRCKPSFLYKISDLLRACEESTNLMIVIYLLERNKVLYANKAFAKLLSGKYHQLLEDGWEYWIQLIDKSEQNNTKYRLFKYFKDPRPTEPLTLRYHIKKRESCLVFLRHDIIIYQLESCSLALNYFFDISDRELVEKCLGQNKISKDSSVTLQEVQRISAREKQVLQLISEGFSSKEIAEKLFISNHTAISHRKNLIDKFKVKNTAHLIKRALMMDHL